MKGVRSAGVLALALLVASAAALAAQTGLRRLRVLGGAQGGASFHEIRAAAFNGSDLVVLNAPAPALHLFQGQQHRAFGARGRGPAELTNPYDAVWLADRMLVRDGDLQKIASYSRAGALVGTRPLPGMAVHLAVAGRDTLVEWYGQTRTVVRLRGARQDTLLRYTADDQTVHLAAPGAPSLTLPAPYEATPVWAGLADGRIAYWNGAEAFVRILDRAGRVAARLAIPPERYPVTAADREAWIATGIPTAIRGQRIFEPLRQQARTQVRFPREFPAVLSLRADPSGGVWVQQSGSASGQRWVHLGEGLRPLRLQLPAGQRLLAVGAAQVAAQARDAQGVESVHVYAKPRR